ncbi:MAG: response regulator [Patescibacteria group bacterium]
MKILLVDDDAFLRDMYAIKFTENGHQVDAADSAAMALRKFEHDQSFDVVLLDMIMPGMSGVELIAALKEKFPVAGTKYIVLSNQGQDDDIEQATKAGAVGYIIKAETVPSDVVTQVVHLVQK